MLQITRHPQNPIITPGGQHWRRATVFNPAAIEHEGRIYLFERAAAEMRPNICWIGALVSDDGVNFTHLSDEPVLSPAMIGWPEGSVQDPRVVKIDDTFYMSYAARPYAIHIGQSADFSMEEFYPAIKNGACNITRSGIATSQDLLTWKHHSFCTPEGVDDRDVILFPEKIDNRFVALRRPLLKNSDAPEGSMWISSSADLCNWSEPTHLASPRHDWESAKIGGSTPPIRTAEGWLILYHGVDDKKVYRVGAMLLDLADPTKVLARTKVPLMQPLTDYETVISPIIGNVIFPCGTVVRDNTLYIYYGCCDFCIALATAPLDELLAFLLLCGEGDDSYFNS